jgi:hypothetical protein
MVKTFKEISMSLLSAKDFQSIELVKSLLKIINKNGEDFIPEIYGFTEPLKFRYDCNDHTGQVEVYMHEEVNKKLSQHNMAAGSLMMHNKKSDVFYHIEWSKSLSKKRFNYFSFSIPINIIERKNNYIDFVNMCMEFASLLNPVYGRITNCSFSDWSSPVNLEIRLPEILWMNFYGKPYIDMFGLEKLLSTPCFKSEKVSENVIALQATESLFQEIPVNVRDDIKRYLGEDAFVWGTKSIWAYKDGKVPDFDFSGVTYIKS